MHVCSLRSACVRTCYFQGQPPEASNLIDLGVDALSPNASGIGTSSSGSTSAQLKAMEAGHVMGGGGGPGGGQMQLPSIPGSIGSYGTGYGSGGGGGGSGYNACGTNNGFPGTGGGGG